MARVFWIFVVLLVVRYLCLVAQAVGRALNLQNSASSSSLSWSRLSCCCYRRPCRALDRRVGCNGCKHVYMKCYRFAYA